MQSCSIVNHVIDVWSHTDDLSKILNLLSLNQQPFPWWDWRFIVPKRKILSLYFKDLTAHMTGIENVAQNALSNDGTYN